MGYQYSISSDNSPFWAISYFIILDVHSYRIGSGHDASLNFYLIQGVSGCIMYFHLVKLLRILKMLNHLLNRKITVLFAESHIWM